MNGRFDAYRIYIAMRFADGLLFYIYATMSMVYQATVVGLNPLQLVLVGTVLETSYFLAEIPTGVVADVYSRRLSIVIGFIVMGAGFALSGAIPLFAAVVLGQVIWGAGATFLSGAVEAWVTDEMAHERSAPARDTGVATSEIPMERVYVRGSQLYQIGALLGIPISVALARLAIPLPIVVAGGLFVLLGIGLALIMPEAGFTRTPRSQRETWADMGRTLRGGVALIRVQPVLITILLIAALSGGFSEGFDRLWTPHLLDNFTLPELTLPLIGALDVVAWFGVIAAVSKLISLGVSELAQRSVRTENPQSLVWVLLTLNLLLTGAVLGFALTTSVGVALLAFWLAGAFRMASQPLYMAWINRYLDPKVRATVLSIAGQSDALGQITVGPGVGLIGTVRSLRAALTVSGLLLLPVSALYGRVLWPGSRVQSPESKQRAW